MKQRHQRNPRRHIPGRPSSGTNGSNQGRHPCSPSMSPCRTHQTAPGTRQGLRCRLEDGETVGRSLGDTTRNYTSPGGKHNMNLRQTHRHTYRHTHTSKHPYKARQPRHTARPRVPPTGKRARYMYLPTTSTASVPPSSCTFERRTVSPLRQPLLCWPRSRFPRSSQARLLTLPRECQRTNLRGPRKLSTPSPTTPALGNMNARGLVSVMFDCRQARRGGGGGSRKVNEGFQYAAARTRKSPFVEFLEASRALSHRPAVPSSLYLYTTLSSSPNHHDSNATWLSSYTLAAVVKRATVCCTPAGFSNCHSCPFGPKVSSTCAVALLSAGTGASDK